MITTTVGEALGKFGDNTKVVEDAKNIIKETITVGEYEQYLGSTNRGNLVTRCQHALTRGGIVGKPQAVAIQALRGAFQMNEGTRK